MGTRVAAVGTRRGRGRGGKGLLLPWISGSEGCGCLSRPAWPVRARGAGKGSGSERKVQAWRRLWVRLQLRVPLRSRSPRCPRGKPSGEGGGGCGKRDCGIRDSRHRAGRERGRRSGLTPGPSGRAAEQSRAELSPGPGPVDSRPDPLPPAAFPARSRGAGPGWHLLLPAPCPGTPCPPQLPQGLPCSSGDAAEEASGPVLEPGSAARACFAEGWTCSCLEAKRGAGS